MAHIPFFSFRGVSRLARRAGLSKSTVSHLIHGKSSPLYTTAERIVKSIETELGKPLKQDELFSENGIYPTPYICELAGCPGCLPDAVYQKNGERREDFLHIRPGKWTGDVNEFEPKKGDHR